MATFECKVYKLKIEEHPNADALELAVVGDYRSIVRKGQFKTGDLGVYIPEAAIVPDWLLEEMGLTGRLAGKEGNRVKAIKLRGILSQGLVVPAIDGVLTRNASGADEDTLFVNEGDDVTEFLGITKWEPPIPVHMAGEVFNAFGMTLSYDIENFKKYPNVLQEGEEVVMTEKLHGTWCCLGYHPDAPHEIVTSKGLSDKGLAFKFNEANAQNLYIRALHSTLIQGDVVVRDGNVINRARSFFEDEPFYILGEIFGKGIQDLTYGLDKPQFRVFDIYVGEPGKGRYLDFEEMVGICKELNLTTVPILYKGPYSNKIKGIYTNGKTVLGETHIREGIVIKPTTERRDNELGRVILKSVSDAYLLRKGGTEYN